MLLLHTFIFKPATQFEHGSVWKFAFTIVSRNFRNTFFYVLFFSTNAKKAVRAIKRKKCQPYNTF